MKHTAVIIIVSAGVLFTAVESIVADEPALSEGMQLELKALESRMKIQRGHVILRATTTSGPHVRQDRSPIDHTFDIEFDGDKMRVKVIDHRYGRSITRIYNGIDYMSDPRDGTQERIQITSRERFEQAGGTAMIGDDFLHPRIVGAYPMPVFSLDNYSVEAALAVTDRSDEKVADTLLNNISAKHISYQRSHGAIIEIWLAPHMGYSILKRKNSGRTLESEYAKLPNGMWYPTRSVLQSFSKGKLDTEETIVVSLADFETPISPERFTFESLLPKTGDVINQNGIDMIWDGKQLVDRLVVETEQQLVESGAVSKSIWVALAIAFAIAAFAVLWMWTAKRSRLT